LEGYLIFSDEAGNYQVWYTKGFGKYLMPVN
jgi:hypothetical protein